MIQQLEGIEDELGSKDTNQYACACGTPLTQNVPKEKLGHMKVNVGRFSIRNLLQMNGWCTRFEVANIWYSKRCPIYGTLEG